MTTSNVCASHVCFAAVHFTGKERDTESGNDYFGARYYASSMGRFLSPDPLSIEMHRLGDPQQLNLYMYGRNNPLKVTDPTGLDITCSGARCSDYLAALQKDVSFKIDLDKGGKVETVGDIDKKHLSKSDKEFLKAIGDTKHHVEINAIDGGKSGSVFFGSSDGSHTGTHTIAFGQAALLDGSQNAGGYTSAQLVGHETLEGYGESQGWGFDASHNWATGLGFPGLDPGKGIGISYDWSNFPNIVSGFTQQYQVHGTSTTENIGFKLVTPIPTSSLPGGLQSPRYPVSVEKAQ
jgi:RHS repeat-associated protein